MKWIVEDAPSHLLVTIQGDWLLASVLKMLDEVGRESRSRGYDRVLVDGRLLGGLITEGDKFVAGSRLPDRLGKTRVALIVSPALRITYFGAKVAANRGGNLFVTYDMDEALRYLHGEPS